MSSIPYSGGTIVNTTFTTTVGTRLEIVNAMETQLVAAGWSVISGAGTGTVILKSAVTPAPKSNSIRVRLFDPGTGNCAQIRIENDAGTLTSQAYYLLPAAAKVFRIIACKYNFFVFNPQPSTARSFVAAGTLHIPTFLESVVTADLGWIQGNGNADTDVTLRQCLRVNFALADWCSQIRNNTLLNVSVGVAAQALRTPSTHGSHSGTPFYRWSDNSLVQVEAIMGFGILTSSDEGKWQGLIHNGMVISEPFAGDSLAVASYDGHAWFAVTQSNSGSASLGRGTLFIAIT